jgi:hypothetical protein
VRCRSALSIAASAAAGGPRVSAAQPLHSPTSGARSGCVRARLPARRCRPLWSRPLTSTGELCTAAVTAATHTEAGAVTGRGAQWAPRAPSSQSPDAPCGSSCSVTPPRAAPRRGAASPPLTSATSAPSACAAAAASAPSSAAGSATGGGAAAPGAGSHLCSSAAHAGGSAAAAALQAHAGVVLPWCGPVQGTRARARAALLCAARHAPPRVRATSNMRRTSRT